MNDGTVKYSLKFENTRMSFLRVTNNNNNNTVIINWNLEWNNISLLLLIAKTQI